MSKTILHTYTVTAGSAVASVSIADAYIGRPDVIKVMIKRLLAELVIQGAVLDETTQVEYTKDLIQPAANAY